MTKSVCFTGHRDVDTDMAVLNFLLRSFLDRLITEQGAADFYTGGAIGFDTIAADTVLEMRKRYPQVKLHLILPCSNAEQTKCWTAKQKERFQQILDSADSVEYISDRYYTGCMKDRNTRLVELADCCISYWNPDNYRSGAGQTVRMAQKKNIPVVNFFGAVPDDEW